MWVWMWTVLSLAMPITELDWRIVNDSVMGGISRSAVEVTDTLAFSGTLSLERNGGFASMRARTPRGALTGAEALRVKLVGDGRTYDLTLRRDDIPLRAGSYRVRVDTQVGETEVLVPLSAFRPTSYGRPVPGAPALDTALERIDVIGLMLADKNPGRFAVEVVEISVVPATRTGTQPRVEAIQTLVDAIDVGVPLYNRGDDQGCRETYASALAMVRSLDVLTPGEHSLIDEALQTAIRQNARDAAWTLRYAMDSILYTGV